MPRLTLKFDLPEEREEFDMAFKGINMHTCLFQISQEVFRPARKHGYPDKEIQELLTKLGFDGEELVSKLEGKFYEILSEHEVNI